MISETGLPWDLIPKGKDLIPTSTEPTGPHRFHWGLDVNRQPSLLYTIHNDDSSIVSSNLPKLQGIDIYITTSERCYLTITLSDQYYRDLFLEFCLLLIQAVETMPSNRDGLLLLVNRCWRWHNFLNTKQTHLLSLEQQQGLYSEATFLQEVLFPSIGIHSALQSWRGPYGSPHDFWLVPCNIEVKSTKQGGSGLIKVSSEDQLALNGASRLVLVHYKLSPNAEGGASLSDLLESISRLIDSTDPGSQQLFQSLIVEAGFSWNHDYSSCKWSIEAPQAYWVEGDFPRITPSSIPVGVGTVKYTIESSHISRFELQSGELNRLLHLNDYDN